MPDYLCFIFLFRLKILVLSERYRCMKGQVNSKNPSDAVLKKVKGIAYLRSLTQKKNESWI